MKKSPLRKQAKAKTPSYWRKKAVEVAKLISKHKAQYTCVSCGRNAAEGFQLHGSHILPESKYHRLSIEPCNIMCQCAKCHMDWHEHPLKSKEWFDEMFPEKYKNLLETDKAFSTGYIKHDYKNLYEQLKQAYNDMIN